MRLIFAGTPPFAAAALTALTEANHDVALVLTQPDRPAGRGMRPQPSAVKQTALQRGLRVAQPASLKNDETLQTVRGAEADLMVVAAYGLLLPPPVLAIPARGCVNIHASLLPRWRGAAPIQRALLAGDRETGITIMQMEAGLDTGPILLQERLSIESADTAGALHDKLADLGARCIVQALGQTLTPQAQDEVGATYARRVEKSEAIIDWRQPADMICRQIRAFNPHPGASTTGGGVMLKVWCAVPAGGHESEPGVVVATTADGIVVAAGSGSVAVLELQRAGGRRLAAPAYLAGGGLKVGMRLGT
jgi:methionyl-tRNA formyltransferase